ncbi:VOC family protein [Halocatena pleomorpha]|uniref:VOC family protein n=1 Tax=Halocatena pleomorpha TaxID=1785090 RepID=A0A3P3RAB8_9EURY|nr:VOC family protein [Halocatena pleomorpha]RRJ29393.1 VOC family protein [Halocatena pleomorpha]
MIQGIYETHLEVSNLAQSIDFFESLGLELSRVEEERGIAFLHIEASERSMIGLWEADSVSKRHFAFRVLESRIDEVPSFLADRGIELRSAFGVEPDDQPLIFPWATLASVYFYDPDGNSIEVTANLSDEADEDLDPIPLDEWRQLHQ